MKRIIRTVIAGLSLAGAVALAQAPADQTKRAKKICEGLTGVVCDPQLLKIMKVFLEQNSPLQAAVAAIDYNDNFYKMLKSQVHKLSNEDRVERGPLNSFTALILGMARDEIPFDQVLYGDIIYLADGGGAAAGTIPRFSAGSNAHYAAAETSGLA